MATDTARTWVPDVAVPPGDTIREILEERAITQADFACALARARST